MTPRGDRTGGQTVEEMLHEFHTVKHVHDGRLPAVPTVDIPPDVRESRVALMAEEMRELVDALRAGDLVKVADGFGDVMYTVVGTAAVCGFLDVLGALVAEVHRSNMAKTNVPGVPKLVKGPGYEPPRIAEVLAGWR